MAYSAVDNSRSYLPNPTSVDIMMTGTGEAKSDRATIDRLHAQISVLQDEITNYQSIAGFEMLREEGLEQIAEASPEEQIQFLLTERRNILDELANSQAQITEVEEQRTLAEAEVEELAADREELTREFTDLRDQMVAEMGAKERELDAERRALLAEKQLHKETLQQLQQASKESPRGESREQIKQKIVDLAHEKTTLTQKVEMLDEKIRSQRREIQAITKEKNDLEDRLETAEQEVEELTSKREEDDDLIQSLEHRLHGVNDEIEELKMNLEKSRNSESQEFKRISDELEEAQSKLQEKDNEVWNVLQKLEVLQAKSLREDAVDDDEQDTPNTKNDDLRRELERTKEENSTLREKLKSISSLPDRHQLESKRSKEDSEHQDLREENEKLQQKLLEASEDLSNNKQQIQALEKALEEAKALCQNQTQENEKLRSQMSSELASLKLKLNDQLTKIHRQNTDGEREHTKSPRTSSRPLRIEVLGGAAADRVVVYKTSALHFATVFECGHHIPSKKDHL